jgi:hypothetical protein
MGARPLVKADQFVDLGPGQAAVPPDERGEPVPFGLVCGGERLVVHT